MTYSHRIRPPKNARGMYTPPFVMPKFWFQAGSESDRDGVEARMKVIPKELQQEVANEYDRIFLQEDRHKGRLEANGYLNKIATEFLKKLKENAPEGA